MGQGDLDPSEFHKVNYEDQRRVIDEFFADKPERVIALPTGQGLVVKL